MIPISICVIAKNEEKHMDSFLSAIQKHMSNYPHEIVLVDTGSTDHTLEIAEKYNCKIYHFKWINDFSAARNYSIQCASFQWILVLDCDEYISKLNLSGLQQLIQYSSKAVGLLSCRNHSWNNGVEQILTNDLNRFFNKKYYHYEDIIHEQLVSNDGNAYTMLPIPLVVDHYGYAGSPDDLKRKAERNNTLLFKQLQENPADPYIYYQLGQSFYLIDDYNNAKTYLEKGLALVDDTRFDYVNYMVNIYASVMLRLGFYQEILSFLENNYDTFANSADFACLMGTVYLRNQKYINAMQQFLKATSYKVCDTEGNNTYVPLFNMGYINELLGDSESAKKLYRSCGNYPAALERLRLLEQ